jgi:hypothetical protein
MRKSILLLTLAALTAGLAVGCAPTSQTYGHAFRVYPVDDRVARTRLEDESLIQRPAVVPVTLASATPQRVRAGARLTRTGGGGGR